MGFNKRNRNKLIIRILKLFSKKNERDNEIASVDVNPTIPSIKIKTASRVPNPEIEIGINPVILPNAKVPIRRLGLIVKPSIWEMNII